MSDLNQFLASEVSPGDTVLDIGCGDKCRTRLLKDNKVFTVDAWDKVKPDLLIDLEVEPLPLGENSFDIIFMIDFIEHLSREAGMRVLAQAKEICRKKIILLTPLWWQDNSVNVNNPSLWCYGNPYDYHKSLWKLEDFEGWVPRNYGNYFLGTWKRGEL